MGYLWMQIAYEAQRKVLWYHDSLYGSICWILKEHQKGEKKVSAKMNIWLHKKYMIQNRMIVY